MEILTKDTYVKPLNKVCHNNDNNENFIILQNNPTEKIRSHCT